MMARKTHIYSLSCPKTGEVKYIGKANDVNNRYCVHINREDGSLKGRWIKSLIEEGLKPSLDIIDEVDVSSWEFWEKHYISLYRAFGFSLVNTSEGGVSSFTHGKKRVYKRKPYVMTEKRRDAIRKLISLKITPWNKGKQYSIVSSVEQREARSIIQKGKHGGKPVAQYSMGGDLIKVWPNAYGIEKELNIGITFKEISGCCRNKSKHAKGFMWKFAKENTPTQIPSCNGIVRKKAVYQYNLSGELIKKWNSCSEIVKELNLDMRNISAAALRSGKHNGFKWSY